MDLEESVIIMVHRRIYENQERCVCKITAQLQ